MDYIYYFGDTDSEASKNLLKRGKIFQKVASVINICNCGFHIKTNQNQFYFTFVLTFFKPNVLSNLILEFKNEYNKSDNSFLFKDFDVDTYEKDTTILKFKIVDESTLFLDVFVFFF